MVAQLSPADRAAVTAAVAAAEERTDGEVVAVVAGRSDAYRDAAAHWAALAALAWLAALEAAPGIAERLRAMVDPWDAPTPRTVVTVALLGAAAAYALAALLLRSERLRVVLTPPGTRNRRARRRALELFAALVQGRTRARTGVLVYLSLAERRAEIVAEEGIHARVSPDRWGEAMAALLAGARAGRPGEGAAEAVRLVGAVLAEHFPRSEDDVNELGDGVIEL